MLTSLTELPPQIHQLAKHLPLRVAWLERPEQLEEFAFRFAENSGPLELVLEFPLDQWNPKARLTAIWMLQGIANMPQVRCWSAHADMYRRAGIPCQIAPSVWPIQPHDAQRWLEAWSLPIVKMPRVLLVMEHYILVPCGSTRVVEAQLRELHRRGFIIDFLLAGNPEAGAAAGELSHELALREKLWPIPLGRVWITTVGGPDRYRTPKTSLSYLQWTAARRSGRKTLSRECIAHELGCLPHGAEADIRSQNHRFALVNYAFNLPILERVGLDELPTIIETHDLLSATYASQENREVNLEEWSQELILLQRAKVALVINHREAARIAEAVPTLSTLAATPPIHFPDIDVATAGCTDLVEVLQAAGISSDKQPMLLSLRGKFAFDLVYVSSMHAPNVVAFNRFFKEVYLTLLAPHGITLAVVGSIEHSPEFQPPVHPLVTTAGTVDDLGPIYAASRVIVLPMEQGAGTAIKTLEAFAARRPMVGTPFAFRGLTLEAEESELFIAEGAEHMASKIRQLLDNPDIWQSAAIAAARADIRLNPIQFYRNIFDTALSLIGIPYTPSSTDDEALAPIPPFPDRRTGMAQIALKAWLLDLTIETRAAAAVDELAKIPALRLWVIRCFEALAQQTAPWTRRVSSSPWNKAIDIQAFFAACCPVADVTLREARQAMLSGDLEHALTQAFSLLERDNTAHSAWLLAAEIFQIAGDRERARASIENALLIAPQAPEVIAAQQRFHG